MGKIQVKAPGLMALHAGGEIETAEDDRHLTNAIDEVCTLPTKEATE